MKKTTKTLAGLLLPLVLAGCGLAQNPDAPAPVPDTTAPQIVAFEPSSGATLEPDQIQIEVRFDEAIDPDSLDGALSVTVDGNAVSGDWLYDAATFTVRFQPDQPFPLDTLVTVSVAPTVTDLAGNPLAAGKTWSFRTPRLYTLAVNASGLIAGASIQVEDAENGQSLTIQGNGTHSFPQRLREGTDFRLELSDPTLGAGDDLFCALDRTRGTLQQDTTVNLFCSPVVPLYGNNGARWNDYLAADGPDPLHAGDNACASRSPEACLHGGELRRFRIPDTNDCSGLTIADDLGAFQWTCVVDDQGRAVAVSTGLAEGKGLRDLIDFQTPTWRTNQVSVTLSDGREILSGESIWWANPVYLPDSTVLTEDGAVYAVSDASPVRQFKIYGRQGLSLVTAPGVSLTPSGTDPALLVNNGSYALWLEVTVDGAGRAKYGIDLSDDVRVVLHQSEVQGASSHGIRISNPSNAPTAGHVLRVVRSHHNGGDGLRVKADGVYLQDVAVYANGGDGLTLTLADHNRIHDLRSASNGGHGLHLDRADGNIIQHAALYNNEGDGLHLAGAADDVLQDILATSNRGAGVVLGEEINHTPSRNNLLRQITAAANGGVGLQSSTVTDAAQANQILGLAAAGNGGDALALGNGQDLIGESAVDGCDGPCPAGVDDTLDLTAFVGAVNDDAVNKDEENGVYYANRIGQWVEFEHDYRAWGLDGGSGTCLPLGTCRVYDWSAAAGSALLDRLGVPSGDDTVTHHWSDASTATFLAHALEMDGNGLCEDGELCLYTPNLGAYPGHGDWQDLPFTDGAISGVTLRKHAQNGR